MIDALPTSAGLNATASVILIGINDILADRSASAIIANLEAIRSMVPNPHSVCIAPFGGHVGWTSGREAVRRTVNDWIRSTPGHTDLETVLGDGDLTQPRIAAQYANVDGLHWTNPDGDAASAEAMYAQSFGSGALI